ncbi:MAG: hypothetical protein LBD14_02070 [Puniceicoccales bacterium]|nr:hypothetical protein [Puniceicoccales bacterium]
MKTSSRITTTVLVGAATLAAVALTPPLDGTSPMAIETVFGEWLAECQSTKVANDCAKKTLCRIFPSILP